MTASAIATTRKRLDLTQVELATLVGVHPLTVSKWERGTATPPPHQEALLNSFEKAAAANARVGQTAKSFLVTAGVALAIFVLLQAAFGDGK